MRIGKIPYYLRSLGATHMEKSGGGGDENKTKAFQATGGDFIESAVDAPKACSILDPDCEACQ